MSGFEFPKPIYEVGKTYMSPDGPRQILRYVPQSEVDRVWVHHNELRRRPWIEVAYTDDAPPYLKDRGDGWRAADTGEYLRHSGMAGWEAVSSMTLKPGAIEDQIVPAEESKLQPPKGMPPELKTPKETVPLPKDLILAVLDGKKLQWCDSGANIWQSCGNPHKTIQMLVTTYPARRFRIAPEEEFYTCEIRMHTLLDFPHVYSGRRGVLPASDTWKPNVRMSFVDGKLAGVWLLEDKQ